tara:strand:- start:26 stop:325 length:300 start_codon:yes stop_codon:yes gene_type:complete
MKTILSTSEIAESLRQYSQMSYKASFAMADYLEEYEESTGEELELDPVAIRCEFTEYENAIEAAAQYTSEFTTEAAAIEYLEDHTTVITYDGGLIIQDF